MIERLLIANRGEIAVRIARTAHRLGISTVGVYSDPDRRAVHVTMVDRAAALGGASPHESYLRAEAVLDAALRNGCDAVHPGYGFLAENADFARAVVDAGLRWVGPTADQIALLGDKVAAKKVAAAAGVPTSEPIEVTPDSMPAGVELPVMVKAAAGGGGRGLRLVRSAGELGQAVRAAGREAESAFGDGTVFLEPYRERGRHVEVQILGDSHGQVIHLGERECSIQRRNQKLIEEAPSAGIDQATRTRLLDSAVALAGRVGYENAGTVEFLVTDPADGTDAAIDFLEVNTRLQVEHPVTEAVTGLDLVELQLLVAAGERLPISQADVRFEGHAIEARLVAEDPASGWFPSSGRIERFRITGEARVDAGVRSGDVIGTDYDSLLAKVIARGPTRELASAVLRRALASAEIHGPRTNRDTLVAILDEPGFRSADTPISYLDEHPETTAAHGPPDDDRLAHLAAVAMADERSHRRADQLWGFAPSGWRNLRTRGQRRAWRDTDREVIEHVEYVVGPDVTELRVGPPPAPGPDGALGVDGRRVMSVRCWHLDADTLVIELDGTAHELRLHRSGEHSGGDRDETWTNGPTGQVHWIEVPRFVDHDAGLVGGGPVAPLPGTVVSVAVTTGDRVDAGSLLVVLEAMKMEHRIEAPGPAVVTDVLVGPGDRVDVGDALVALQAPDDPEAPDLGAD